MEKAYKNRVLKGVVLFVVCSGLVYSEEYLLLCKKDAGKTTCERVAEAPSKRDVDPLEQVWPGQIVGEGVNRKRVWSTRTHPQRVPIAPQANEAIPANAPNSWWFWQLLREKQKPCDRPGQD